MLLNQPHLLYPIHLLQNIDFIVIFIVISKVKLIIWVLIFIIQEYLNCYHFFKNFQKQSSYILFRELMMDLEFKLNHHRFKVLYLNFYNFIHVISILK